MKLYSLDFLEMAIEKELKDNQQIELWDVERVLTYGDMRIVSLYKINYRKRKIIHRLYPNEVVMKIQSRASPVEILINLLKFIKRIKSKNS